MVPMWMFPVAIVTEIVLSSNHQSVTLQPQYLLQNGLKSRIPDGVFNVIQGDKIAVDSLIRHQDVRAIVVGLHP